MNLPNIRLPNDVAAYVRKRVTLRVAFFVALELSCLCLLLFAGDALFSKVPSVPRTLIYLAICILPCPITGVPHKLMDKSWRGRVTKVEIETRNAFTKEGQPRMYGENVIILTIETETGKHLRREVANYGFQSIPWNRDCPDIKADHYVCEYHTGDYVYHFYGLKHLLIFSEGNDRTIPCVVCGQINDSQAKRCWECSHTLTKPNS